MAVGKQAGIHGQIQPENRPYIPRTSRVYFPVHPPYIPAVHPSLGPIGMYVGGTPVHPDPIGPANDAHSANFWLCADGSMTSESRINAGGLPSGRSISRPVDRSVNRQSTRSTQSAVWPFDRSAIPLLACEANRPFGRSIVWLFNRSANRRSK